MQRLAKFLLVLAAVLLLAWTAGALAFSPYGSPGVRLALATGFSLAAVAAGALSWRRGANARRRFAWASILACTTFAICWHVVLRPANDRAWSADQARLPRIQGDGDRVRIENVRNFTYRSTVDYTPRWETRDYDLSRVERLWFVLEPFSSFPGAAHTFLSFGFDDGRHLAVSAEIRKEPGESFSPWRGLYRNYELMYVFGDERDLITLRTDHRKDTVYLYPVRASPAQVRAVLEDVLRRAAALEADPEFYNTATSNCTTNIAAHANAISPGRVPFSWHLLLPGHADARALELGLIAFDGSLDEARQRFRINGRPPERWRAFE